MNRKTRHVALALGVSVLVAPGAPAQDKHGGHGGAPSPPKGSVRITPEELHRQGGVPRGWRFAIPAGNAGAGREVFTKLECYKCHEVKGGGFPTVARTAENAGPELTTMGGHHPPEYFAESVINPNAVIVTGRGHTGPDGLSIMPDYRDSLTVAEFIDLIAYLKSLRAGSDTPPAPTSGKTSDTKSMGGMKH